MATQAAAAALARRTIANRQTIKSPKPTIDGSRSAIGPRPSTSVEARTARWCSGGFRSVPSVSALQNVARSG